MSVLWQKEREILIMVFRRRNPQAQADRQVRPTMPAARPARQTERHNTSDFQTAPPLHPSTFQCGADLNLSSRDFRPKNSDQASSASKLGETNGKSQFDHCVRAISIEYLNTSVVIQVQ